jgi:hypothetical protein
MLDLVRAAYLFLLAGEMKIDDHGEWLCTWVVLAVVECDYYQHISGVHRHKRRCTIQGTTNILDSTISSSWLHCNLLCIRMISVTTMVMAYSSHHISAATEIGYS